MKGKKTFAINGKDISFRFDLNALERYTEHYNISMDELEPSLNKIGNIKFLIQCLSISGGNELSLDEVGSMDISLLTELMQMVKGSAGND